MATTETACRSSPGCSNEQIGEMGQTEHKIQTELTGRIEQTKRTGQKKQTGSNQTGSNQTGSNQTGSIGID